LIFSSWPVKAGHFCGLFSSDLFLCVPMDPAAFFFGCYAVPFFVWFLYAFLWQAVAKVLCSDLCLGSPKTKKR